MSESRLTKWWLNSVDWYRRQPMALKILLLVLPLLIGKIVDQLLKWLGAATSLPDWAVAALVVVFLAIAAMASRSLHHPEEADSFPPLDFGDLEVHNSFSIEQLERLRTGLHQEIYGGAAPLGDEITRMYLANPVMGVGLYDPARRDYVAFATAWPLTDASGEKLIRGEITENDLVATDILPADQNGKANYVIVPAFGATKRHGLRDRTALGFKLSNELRRAMRRNFFPNRRRAITLIATGFSEDGCKWCRGNQMQERTRIRFADSPKSYPVFSRRLVWDDID